MNTYEIRIELHTGYTLNLLVSAFSREDAIRDGQRILHGVGVKLGREYSASGMDARAVVVTDDHSIGA